jgi:hypothetical protein
MNWLMVVVGALQFSAAGYGWYTGQSWRVNSMNILVGLANIILAGQK